MKIDWTNDELIDLGMRFAARMKAATDVEMWYGKFCVENDLSREEFDALRVKYKDNVEFTHLVDVGMSAHEMGCVQGMIVSKDLVAPCRAILKQIHGWADDRVVDINISISHRLEKAKSRLAELNAN